MRITVWGAGSLGLLFAGKLAGSGYRTELVPRSAAQREELQANGVKVLEPDGEECRSRPIVTENPAGARDNPDWIFLMVKQKDIGAGLAGQLAGRMGESTRLLCFQNGAGHLERLGAMLPPDRIYAAVTTEAARKESPWEVRHTGKGTILWGIPKPFEGGTSPAVDASLNDVLRRAGFTPQRSEDIRTAMWDKLLINAVINPLTGLLSVPNGALLENRESEDLMRRLLQEGIEVLTREGYSADNTLWDRVRTVCRQTAANSSSMLQDLTKGRKTEIEWINGYLLRLADKHGVDLPVNRTLYSLIKLKEGQG